MTRALDDLFLNIFPTEIESQGQESGKPRVNIYILIGKLGLHQGKQKILGVYPTAEQAEARRIECFGIHDTLFRKYMIAQVSVTADGAACDLQF